MEENLKQLLLKDLCARLQYKLHCRVFKLNEDIKENDDILYGIIGDNVMTLKSDKDECLMYYQIKPYLRSLSNMTNEEAMTIFELYGCNPKDILQIKITNEYLEAEVDDGWCSSERHVIWYDEIVNSIQVFDFLNLHYFDYQGLIPKGLAIAVIEENNPYK